MNHDHLDHLICSHLHGTITQEELHELEHRLLHSAADRARFWQEAEAHAMLHEVLQASLGDERAQKPSNARKLTAWLGFRPLMAAAAGIVFGMFFATMAWALSSQGGGIRRVPLPLANPGFEQNESLPQVHLVPRVNQWSGVTTEIVESSPHRPPTFSGKGMLKLGPSPEGRGYYASTMTDLNPPYPSAEGTLQIEVTARYHSSQPNRSEQYGIKVAVFEHDAATVASHLNAEGWQALQEVSLSHTGKSLYLNGTESGWQTLRVRLDVPSHARTLLLTLGATTRGPADTRTDHYIDDVQADWIILPSSNISH